MIIPMIHLVNFFLRRREGMKKSSFKKSGTNITRRKIAELLIQSTTK
jgi:hypothetical protein